MPHLNRISKAYLLTVDFPKHSPKNLSYHIFKVELTDLENGNRGGGGHCGGGE